MGTPARSSVVRFATFEVDLVAGEVRKSGVRQKLAPQPFEVLRVLLERPQELVTREELRQHIWPKDTFVDYDLGLRRAITRLREVLGDSADSPRFIETIPRRGYRFIAPLNEHGSVRLTEPPVVAPATSSGRPRFSLQVGLMIGLGVTALLGATLAWVPSDSWRRLLGKPAVPKVRSLAVLPLQNLSDDPAQEYFSDGMTDALITDLAQIGSLRVISRTSSMQYRATKKSLPEIAHELNVDGIVEGTVQRSGDRVRITAQLIHGPSDKHLWAKSYERDVHDIFALEREVTDDVANEVRAQVTPRRQPSSVQPRPVNQNALDAYLQGKYHLDKALKGPRGDELRSAEEFFQHGIDADPTFVSAYLGLAEAHANAWWPSAEDFEIQRASAAKALQLDPTSSEAHTAVGFTKELDWDWIAGEEECRRAIELNPNNAEAHDLLGGTFDLMGQMDEGLKEFEIAQQLDPNRDHLSDALYERGQYDRSIELLQRMAKMHPDDGSPHYFLSEDYAQKRMYAESVRELVEFLRRYSLPEVAIRIDHAFANSGWREAQLQWAKELEQLIATKQVYSPGVLAQVYAQLGDKDRAFYWLNQGIEHRHLAISDPRLVGVKTYPSFAPLRSDPRFKVLLRRMGLPE